MKTMLKLQLTPMKICSLFRETLELKFDRHEYDLIEPKKNAENREGVTKRERERGRRKEVKRTHKIVFNCM